MRRMTVVRKTLILVFAFMAWIGPICLPHELILLMRLITLVFAIDGCRKQQVARDGFFWLTCIYSAVMLLSVFLFDRTVNHVLKTFSYVLVPITIYLFTTHADVKESFMDALMIGTVGCFSIDAFLAFFTTAGTGINRDGQPLYFVGGKFQICYLYMLLMLLCFLRFKQRKRMKALMTLFGLITAVHVDCNTGALGILAMGMMMFLKEDFISGKKLYGWFGGTILLNYLIVFVQIQLTSPLIRSFIEDVLHRRADLTGRMGVYNNVSGFMEGHWLLGYGYTSDHILEYTSSHWLGGIVNTQNGFLQIIYTVGLVGLVLYCALLFMLLKKIEKINTVEQKIVLLAAFVGFFVIAIVEIPLTSGVFNIIIGCVLLLSREEYQQETENSEG